MKFIDTLTEEDKKKLIKKAKLIFSIFKKGTITRGDGVSFSYELKDNMVPRVVKGEVEISAFITEIIERTYCPINEHAMKDLIVKKFNHFNINAEIYYTSNSHVEKYKGKKPWEEQSEDTVQPINEALMRYTEDDLTDKDRKKVKLIYDLFKTGRYTDDDMKYEYVLPDEYYLSVDDETGIPVVILPMDPTQTLDLFMVLTNTYIPKVDKEYNNLYKETKRRIKEKFNNFNIDIVF